MFRRRGPLTYEDYQTGNYGLTRADLAVAWAVGVPIRLAPRAIGVLYRLRRKRHYIADRLRARALSAVTPGLTVERDVTIGPRCSVDVAPGGRIALRGTKVQPGVALSVAAGASLTIGNGRLGRNCIVAARESITIRDGAALADHVTVRDHNHPHTPERGFDGDRWVSAPVLIDELAMLGSKATVVAGVTVGPRSLVAAGAVVTRDVQPGTKVGGVPAKPLGRG